MFQLRKHGLVLPVALALAAGPAFAATITVNSSADTAANDGVCTLREAITSASMNAVSGLMTGECAAGSAAPAVDTINFNIPSADTGCVGTPKRCTIKPATTFPLVTNPVFIDGYTQSGASMNTLAVGDNAVLTIELDATNLNPVLYLQSSVFGPTMDSSGSTIRGLAVSHIGGSGLCACQPAGTITGITITGNFLGTDPTGMLPSGSGTAVYMTTGSGAIIGGTTPAERNVIGPGGIQLSTASTSTVQGNYIGLDKTGTAQLSTVPGLGIGVSAGSDNLIGGSTAGAGNVIGGWAGNGIQLDGVGNNNRVQGNLIGTNATGTAKLPGGQHGIAYFGSGTGNKIGGTAAGEGNLIAAASIEGIILNGTSTDLVVQGNLIGTDSSGDMPFGNFDGILAQTGKGMIGGTAAGAGNRIAFNGSLGVAINTGQPGWAILGNQIYENGSLGISLSGGGVPTGNDDGDADTGANNLQNYPVITTATIAAGMASISGTLNSSAGTAFRLEFFASSSCDPSTNGEGETFIGFANVSTVGNVATFGPLDFALPAGQTAITATATDPNNNTSEFSVCKATNGIFSDSFETPAT